MDRYIYERENAVAVLATKGAEVKKKTTVKVMLVTGPATIDTNEGMINIDDEEFYLATDGHRIWPLDIAYFARNYELVK